MSELIKTVTDQSFLGEVLQSGKPVLVDYWAEWCGPCKMIAPLLEELAAEYADRVVIAKLNVDDNPAMATRYSVRSIPTLMLFKGGQPVAAHIGSLSSGRLRAFIDEHLSLTV